MVELGLSGNMVLPLKAYGSVLYSIYVEDSPLEKRRGQRC